LTVDARSRWIAVSAAEPQRRRWQEEIAVVSLRTARLLLRPWRDDDVAAFAELSADPAVMQFLRPLPDRADRKAWAARARLHWHQHGFGQWVVEIPGEARFIGVVGLARIAYEAHFTPAVEIGLDEIVAVTVPDNWRSRRVMERLGMTRSPAEDFDHPNLPEGPLRRHVLYRLRRKSSRP
jgi:RimJ/RimL family protein N-acetyltransferase